MTSKTYETTLRLQKELDLTQKATQKLEIKNNTLKIANKINENKKRIVEILELLENIKKVDGTHKTTQKLEIKNNTLDLKILQKDLNNNLSKIEFEAKLDYSKSKKEWQDFQIAKSLPNYNNYSDYQLKEKLDQFIDTYLLVKNTKDVNLCLANKNIVINLYENDFLNCGEKEFVDLFTTAIMSGNDYTQKLKKYIKLDKFRQLTETQKDDFAFSSNPCSVFTVPLIKKAMMKIENKDIENVLRRQYKKIYTEIVIKFVNFYFTDKFFEKDAKGYLSNAFKGCGVLKELLNEYLGIVIPNPKKIYGNDMMKMMKIMKTMLYYILVLTQIICQI